MFNRSKNNQEVFQAISERMKYGAPELIQNYRKFLFKGLLTGVTVAAVLSFSALQYILKAGEKSLKEIMPPERIFHISETEVDVKTPVKEVEEVVSKSIPLKDLSALTPEPVAKNNVKEDISLKNQSELEEVKLPVSSKGTEDISQVTPDFTGKVDEVKIDENIETVKESVSKPLEQFEVEKAPAAINLGSIQSSMRYPEIARLSGKEGRVIVRLLIGKDGSVEKIGKISGPDEFRDEVSDKVMDLRFTPALQKNEAVKCWVSVPFSFKLDK
ncbi:MAG TPA: TonB family protein [Ignavibacteria bacterium]|nr:TonB family protein [Ignavibacteria bacterium]